MPRGLKVLCGLLVLVLLLAGAAVGVSYHVAMRSVQSRVAARLGEDPSRVHVASSQRILLPVLTSGTLDDLSVDVDEFGLTVRGQDVTLRSARAELTDLTHVREPDALTAGSLRASAVMGWDAIASATGLTVSRSGDGTVEATTTVSAVGAQLPVTITSASPAVAADGTVTLTGAGVRVADSDLPDALAQPVLAEVQDRLRLPEPPEGLGYSGLEIVQDGMRVALSGQDVTTSRLGG